MTDLRIVTKACEDVTSGVITHDQGRTIIADMLSTTIESLTDAMGWARNRFDPKRHLVSLTWHPMTQMEASIMAHEAFQRSRYGRR